jgi:hypothetical protein
VLKSSITNIGGVTPASLLRGRDGGVGVDATAGHRGRMPGSPALTMTELDRLRVMTRIPAVRQLTAKARKAYARRMPIVIRSSARAMLLLALLAVVHGCGGPKADWEKCVADSTANLDGYRKLHALAIEKVRALPPPGTDATAIANRKVLDDALALTGEGIASLEVAVAAIRSTVDTALASADGAAAAAAVQNGCTNLAAARKQTADKVAAVAPAIQLYNQMTAK